MTKILTQFSLQSWYVFFFTLGEIGKKTSSQQPNINTNNERSMSNHGSSRKEVANQPQEIQEHDLQDSHGNAASSGSVVIKYQT